MMAKFLVALLAAIGEAILNSPKSEEDEEQAFFQIEELVKAERDRRKFGG